MKLHDPLVFNGRPVPFVDNEGAWVNNDLPRGARLKVYRCSSVAYEARLWFPEEGDFEEEWWAGHGATPAASIEDLTACFRRLLSVTVKRVQDLADLSKPLPPEQPK